MIICLIYIIFISFLFAEDIDINQDFGTIIIDEVVYNKPFLGGFNKPKIQWLDWDYDGDSDLFLLDEDGHIKYYNNITTDSIEFSLMNTEFLGLSNISWF